MADTMKNNIALIILLIAFLSVACNERQSNNRQLTLDFPIARYWLLLLVYLLRLSVI